MIVLLWGLTAILTVVCTDYTGILIQRLFLGLAESAVSPAFVTVTGLWYKPYEQATRLGIWYSATGIFSMVSGLINFGLGHAKIEHPWMAMYYFCGSVTMAWAFVVWFILPTSPAEPGRFFNDEEKEILAKRLQENPYIRDRQRINVGQLVEAVLDYKTWVYLVLGAAIYVSA